MKDAISIGCKLISSGALREAGHGHQTIWFLQKKRDGRIAGTREICKSRC